MDGADAWNLAKILGEAGEVAKIEGLDDEVDVDSVVIGGAGLH